MAETWTLKVDFDGDLRRFRLGLDDKDTPSIKIGAIHKAIYDGFNLDEVHTTLVLKYKDEDGDACTLVAATVDDLLSSSSEKKTLRLLASRPSRSAKAAAVLAGNEEGAATHATGISATAPATADCDAAVTAWPGAGYSAHNNAEGCNSVGPWKLLMCLRALHEAGMMSAKMVASMVLQFLPILCQRAHRKQSKLNKLGPQMREALTALLHSVSAHLDLVEEAKPVKPLLEEFITGSDVSRLGDTVAALLKALSTCKDRHAVAEAITGVAPDLLESMPKLFPELFNAEHVPSGAAPPEHQGIRCSACSREPIKGPRFHCAEACIDLCGECFIDQGCESIDQQFQCIFAPLGAQADCLKAWKDQKALWKGQKWEAWKDAWKDQKALWKSQKWEWCKGKGKGKGKWNWWHAHADDAFDEAASAVSESTVSAQAAGTSDAGDSCPPGLELPHHHHHWGGAPWWKGKGKGKGKDWSPMWSWGWPMESDHIGAAMNQAFQPPFWGCDSWPHHDGSHFDHGSHSWPHHWGSHFDSVGTSFDSVGLGGEGTDSSKGCK